MHFARVSIAAATAASSGRIRSLLHICTVCVMLSTTQTCRDENKRRPTCKNLLPAAEASSALPMAALIFRPSSSSRYSSQMVPTSLFRLAMTSSEAPLASGTLPSNLLHHRGKVAQ